MSTAVTDAGGDEQFEFPMNTAVAGEVLGSCLCLVRNLIGDREDGTFSSFASRGGPCSESRSIPEFACRRVWGACGGLLHLAFCSTDGEHIDFVEFLSFASLQL